MDPFSEQVAVGEFRFDPADQWVSWEMRLSPVQQTALAASGSLSTWLKCDGLTGDSVDVWLEAGSLAEDFDGNGLLTKSLAGNYGITFQDSVRGVSLVAAPAYQNTASVQLSKDANANGILDPEGLVMVANPARSYTGTTASFAPGSGSWTEYRMTLSRADRIKLQKASALRLIVRKKSAGSTVAGRLLWGQTRIDLPGMTASGSAGMTATAGTGSRQDVHRLLAAAFPVARKADSPPAYALLDWQGGAGGSAVFAQSLDPVSLARFGVFRLYVRGEAIPAAGLSSLVIRLQDEGGSYASQPFDPGLLIRGLWYVAEFDFTARRFTLRDSAGNAVVSSSCRISGSPHAISSVQLQFDALGASAGQFMVDNLLIDQGIAQLTVANNNALDWTHAGTLWAIDSFPLVSGLRVHEKVNILTEGGLQSQPGLDNDPRSRLQWSGVLGASLAGVDVEIGNDLAFSQEAYGGQLSYRLALPSGWSFPLNLTDGFSGSVGTAETRITKNSSLGLNAGSIGSLQASAGDYFSSGLLRQDWGLGLNLLPGQPFWLKLDGSFSQDADPPSSAVPSSGMSLADQWGKGYAWYLPVDDAVVTKRGILVKDLFGFVFSPVELSFGQNLAAGEAAADQYRFTSSLGFNTEIRIKGSTSGEGLTITYQRASNLAENWHGHDGFADLGRAWDDWGRLWSSWAAWPVWELFDPSPSFGDQSGAWPAARIRPSVSAKLARALDSAWWAMLLPKQVDGGLARQLSRKGESLSDDFLATVGGSWLLLNQFGRQGSAPAFAWYESDQLEFGVDSANLFQEHLLRSWQIQLNAKLRLFGLSRLPGASLGTPGASTVRRTDGVLEVIEPDQFTLGANWLNRTGDSAVTAFGASLDFSWSLDVAGLEDGFFKRKPSSPVYLENIESLTVGSANGPSAESNKSTAFSDLYSSSIKGDYPSQAGFSLIFRHKTYLILPGLAYVGVFLGYGYESATATGLSTNAVQAGIEARLKF
jgi:hypothetical protein